MAASVLGPEGGGTRRVSTWRGPTLAEPALTLPLAAADAPAGAKSCQRPSNRQSNMETHHLVQSLYRHNCGPHRPAHRAACHYRPDRIDALRSGSAAAVAASASSRWSARSFPVWLRL